MLTNRTDIDEHIQLEPVAITATDLVQFLASTMAGPRDLAFNHVLPLTNRLNADFFNFVSWTPEMISAWMGPAQQLFAMSPYVIIAAHASLFANLTNDTALARIADGSYQKGIQFVQQYIADASISRFFPQLNAAINNLQVYEVNMFMGSPQSTEFPTGTWLKHNLAKEKMIQHLGPLYFSTESRVRALFDCLPAIVYRALADRTPTFLASADWLAVLENMRQYGFGATTFWHITVKIPELMNYFDLLDNTSMTLERRTRALHSLLDLVSRISRKLDAWVESFESGSLRVGQLYWFSTAVIVPSSVCFSPSVQFSDIEIASVITLSWAIQLKLATLSDDIHTKLASGPANVPDNPDFAKYISRSYHFASMIGHSAQFWLTTDAIPHNYLSDSFTFARTVAWHWFEAMGCREETRAFAATRELMLAETLGWAAELFIDNIYLPPPNTPVGRAGSIPGAV